jgi:hypothetical protein
VRQERCGENFYQESVKEGRDPSTAQDDSTDNYALHLHVSYELVGIGDDILREFKHG